MSILNSLHQCAGLLSHNHRQISHWVLHAYEFIPPDDGLRDQVLPISTADEGLSAREKEDASSHSQQHVGRGAVRRLRERIGCSATSPDRMCFGLVLWDQRDSTVELSWFGQEPVANTALVNTPNMQLHAHEHVSKCAYFSKIQ